MYFRVRSDAEQGLEAYMICSKQYNLWLFCKIGSASSSTFIKLMYETQFWRQQHIKQKISDSACLKLQVASLSSSVALNITQH